MRTLLVTLRYFLLAMAGCGLLTAGEFTWNYKPTDSKVTLVQRDGKRVVLDPTTIQPTKATKWYTSWTIYFAVRGETSDSAVSAPMSFELGTINPKKLVLPLNIVKLEKKDGKRLWTMKGTADGFFPFPESEVFPKATAPLPVKNEAGVYVITLPKALEPGEYVLMAESEAWEFTVK